MEVMRTIKMSWRRQDRGLARCLWGLPVYFSSLPKLGHPNEKTRDSLRANATLEDCENRLTGN
jgi:hypothetical protein